MSIKPFIDVVKDENIIEEKVKPFVDMAQGGVVVEENNFGNSLAGPGFLAVFAQPNC